MNTIREKERGKGDCQRGKDKETQGLKGRGQKRWKERENEILTGGEIDWTATEKSQNYVLLSFPKHFSLTSMENVTRS